MPFYEPPPPIPPMTFRWVALGRDDGGVTFAASSPADLARAAADAAASYASLTGQDTLALKSRSYYRHAFSGLVGGWRLLSDDWPDPDDGDALAAELRGRADWLWRESLIWYVPEPLPSAESA